MGHPFTATVLSAQGATEERSFDITRMYNLGSATRDADVAVHHQKEVADAGVRIAFDVPAPRIYPIAPYALTSAEEIQVHSARTSGEVEIVVIAAANGELFIGVGSDHTDRDLERASILYSKQACPNILAPTLWRWSEVAAHWDQCLLESWVDGQLYQQTLTESFIAPPDLMALLRERADVPAGDVVLYAGTIVALEGRLAFGSQWQFRLHDPVLEREITHAYSVAALMPEIREGFRVPVFAD